MSDLARTPRISISPRPSSVGALRRAGTAIGAALSRVGALPSDSREGLRSPEQQLAAYGVRWATDLAYETELAQELAAAGQQRRACVAAPRIVPPVAPDDAPGERVAGTAISVGVGNVGG